MSVQLTKNYKFLSCAKENNFIYCSTLESKIPVKFFYYFRFLKIFSILSIKTKLINIYIKTINGSEQSVIIWNCVNIQQLL